MGAFAGEFFIKLGTIPDGGWGEESFQIGGGMEGGLLEQHTKWTLIAFFPNDKMMSS